jgi:hypothetical protein
MPQAFERFYAHRPMIRKPAGIFEIALMKTFERFVEITHRLSPACRIRQHPQR